MTQIIKLIILIIESFNRLVDFKKTKEFENNVEEIDKDPWGYLDRNYSNELREHDTPPGNVPGSGAEHKQRNRLDDNRR